MQKIKKENINYAGNDEFFTINYDDRFGNIVIGEEEYTELEKNIDSILPELHIKRNMANFYGEATIRNTEKTYFDKLTKKEDRKKFIKLLILFKKGTELPDLLETIK